MAWLLFESGVALLILIAIVAWTVMPLWKGRREQKGDHE